MKLPPLVIEGPPALRDVVKSILAAFRPDTPASKSRNEHTSAPTIGACPTKGS